MLIILFNSIRIADCRRIQNSNVLLNLSLIKLATVVVSQILSSYPTMVFVLLFKQAFSSYLKTMVLIVIVMTGSSVGLLSKQTWVASTCINC